MFLRAQFYQTGVNECNVGGSLIAIVDEAINKGLFPHHHKLPAFHIGAGYRW